MKLVISGFFLFETLTLMWNNGFTCFTFLTSCLFCLHLLQSLLLPIYCFVVVAKKV